MLSYLVELDSRFAKRDIRLELTVHEQSVVCEEVKLFGLS